MRYRGAVTGDELDALLRAPVGTVVANGPMDWPSYFVKAAPDMWRPSTQYGEPYSDRPWEHRFVEPLYEGPFESAQLLGPVRVVGVGGVPDG